MANKDDCQQTLCSDESLPISFNKKRHTTVATVNNSISKSWRIRDRMKTVSVALVVCLNVGVDPPDVFKITPCARLECWIDPSSVSPQKALEMIGINLQRQYERWQPRARYKQSLDPTVEDIKKLCSSLRRNAKEERVLFHYNGHGVPRPTVNGEVWVFNRTYTQYIPLSIYDLQTWMGAPSIYVYDCSNAGIIVNSFNQFAEQHERELDQVTGTLTSGNVPSSATIAGGGGGVVNRDSPNDAAAASSPNGSAANTSSNTIVGGGGTTQSSAQPQQHHHNQHSYRNCIQMAACTATQILPMNPQLPADLFTACLTTPIKIGLKWFTLQQSGSLLPKLSSNFLERIPGRLNDRRTMLGELNWIFTAITDTIAWNTMPRELFQKLFRQDLLVASLFRNYLLADRIMRSYDCTPITCPELPSAHRHPMWSAWDLCVDLALQQLPNMLENGYEYENLTFFEDQLTAFHVWLERGSQTRTPPLQLPIVLQVLLSQVHRIRALELLGKFLDLGPWAVHTALSVGIFPYVLKLLQASSKELRPLLVFIWAKILAVDSTCQVDLVCDKGHKYFLSVLQDTTIEHEYRTMAAFILASIVHNFPLGQANCLQGSMVSICLVHICDYDSMLRQWLAICLGNLWQNYDKARWSGVRDLAHDKLYPLLVDPIPDVRAAAVYALGTFISSVTNHKDRTEHANNIDRSIAMTLINTVGNDMSPMVRMELIAALQWMVILFESQFVSVFLQEPTMGIGNLPAAAAAAIHLPTAHHPTGLPHPPASQQHHHHHHTHSLERNINIKRVSSSSSIANMSGSGSLINFHPGTTTIIGFGSIYMKLWQGLIQLCRDPYPDVAQMATKVIDFIVNQAVDLISAKEATKENFTACSLSLPPSPNTRNCYLGESPPHHINHVMSSKSGKQSPITVAAAAANALTSTLDDNNVTAANIYNKGRHGSRSSTPTSNHHHSITNRSRRNSKTQHPIEDTTDSSSGVVGGAGDAHHQSSPPPQSQHQPNVSNPMNTCTNSTTGAPTDYQQKAIVGTAFLHWAVGQFSSAATLKTEKYDCHAPEELDRIVRFQRNDEIRRIGREQHIHSAHKRLETQYWIGRTQFPPHIIKLHPYEPQIAVAYKNKIMINDMQRNVIQSYVPQSVQLQNNKSPPYHSIVSHMVMNGGGGSVSQSRVTAVDFVNAHDKTLILAGYEDGIIRIWRPSDATKESKLITAWQAIGDVTRSKFSTTSSSSTYGLVMAWQQRSQTCAIASGNDPTCIRCWNVETELKICDIRTGTDSPIIVLTTGLNELLAAGCVDGSVRLYDKRLAPTDAKVMTFRESTTAILSVCLRDDCERLITGCSSSQNNVRIFDVRKNSSLYSWTVDGEVTAMAIHSAADVIAGGTNCITTYTLDGQPLSTIRPHGFMGPRISNTTCLSFHPWKVNLAAGFVDTTVAVYVTDSKRN